MREVALLTLSADHQPDAVRRTVAAELCAAAMQGGRALAPGVGLGLFSIAALLDRRTPFDAGDVDRLREAVCRLLEVLVPGRPAAVAEGVVPLRFARLEPVRVRR